MCIIKNIKRKKKTSENNKTDPNLPGWPSCACSYGNFHLTLVGSRQNQVRSHLGGLAHFSYEQIIFL